MPRHQHEERIGRSISLAAAKRSCLDKHPYDSRSIARDAQAKNAKRYGWAPQKPYRCTLCGHWHLTTIRVAPERKA
jgi:hypothetical protein